MKKIILTWEFILYASEKGSNLIHLPSIPWNTYTKSFNNSDSEISYGTKKKRYKWQLSHVTI